MNRILFIQPPLEMNYKHKRILPLGIGYLLAVIRKEFPDVSVKFLDMESGNLSIDYALKYIIEFNPDILMISYWTAMADSAFSIMKSVKQIFDDKITIIAGGVHPSIYPEESLEYADYVVKFEGETTIIELLQALNKKNDLNLVKGIVFKSDGMFKYSGDREFIEDLDSIPFPAWDLMPMENYDTPMHITGGRRMPVMGSRGCPYACSYCVSPYHWKRKLRWRSVKNVVDEIEKISNDLKIDKIHFWDDNLFLKKDYIRDLCNEIITRGLEIQWLGLTRASHIVQCSELMPLIKKSGCIGMEMGIESADAQSHKAVNKEENIEVTLEAAEILKKNNMVPMFTYMALNPGDTLTTYYKQAEIIDKILKECGWIKYFHPLPVPLYIGQLCTPHPGTKLFEEAKNIGIVNAKKWSDYYHHRVNFIPDSLLYEIPVKQIEKLTYREILLCVKAMISSVYIFIQPDSSFFKRMLKIAEYIKFVRMFYNECAGNLSVKEIALKLETKIKLNEDILWNYSAVTVIVLSQIGFIQNIDNSEVFPIRNIDISGFKDSTRLAKRLHIIDLIINFNFDLFFQKIRRVKLKIKNKIYAYRLYLSVNTHFLAFNAPYRFSICPTYKCNTNCIACWCYSPEIQEDKKLDKTLRTVEIPFSKLSETVKYLLDNGTFYFSISGGGEPMLYSKIENLIKLIKSKPYSRIDLNTNFLNMDNRKIRMLIDNNVDTVIISLWAASAETYKITHPSASPEIYNNLISSISKINLMRLSKKKNVNVILNYVILSLNFFEFKGMIELAYITKSSQIRFTHVDIVKGQTEKLMLTHEQAEKIYQEALEIKSVMNLFEKKYCHKVDLIEFDFFERRLKNIIEKKNNDAEYDSGLFKKFNCYAGWAYFQIFPDGIFNSCCRIVNARGNINENSFADIWNGKKQIEFRKLTYQLDKTKINNYNLPCSGLCDNLQDTIYIKNILNTVTLPEKILLKPVSKLLGFVLKIFYRCSGKI
ncbi:radical SAM protein [Candidatus Dependentiae bacterium]|nr:radical SAM protein [Candidatus Dependentiae bacterium]